MHNSEFTEKLSTRAFLVPMDEDEELEVELSQGNTVTLKYKAISELQPNGTRCRLCLLLPKTVTCGLHPWPGDARMCAAS